MKSKLKSIRHQTTLVPCLRDMIIIYQWSGVHKHSCKEHKESNKVCLTCNVVHSRAIALMALKWDWAWLWRVLTCVCVCLSQYDFISKREMIATENPHFMSMQNKYFTLFPTIISAFQTITFLR